MVVLGTGIFLAHINESPAIADWLLWRYVVIEFGILFWAMACASAGHTVVLALTQPKMPRDEHALVSMAIGVLIFFILTAVVGYVGLLNSGYFFWGPLLLLGIGAQSSLQTLTRLSWNYQQSAYQPSRTSLLASLGVIAGFVGLALVFWCTLSPESMSADGRWYHLALSEQYAATGRISAYPEGWFFAAYPHLASTIYTWAFLLPGFGLFEHVVMAIQMELICACVAWASVPVLVARILGRAPTAGVWAFTWLFPASFVYLPNAGADLVATMWSGPLFLVMLRAWRRLDVRDCVLLGLLVAGTINTKYSASILVIPVFAFVLRASVLFARSTRSTGSTAGTPSVRHILYGSIALGGTVLLATAPHWLKNMIFYGDPLYPLGRQWFSAQPWTSMAERLQEHFWNQGELMRPPATLGGLEESLLAVIDFSFIPRHFGYPRINQIFFGSLFTLSLPLLPLVRSPRRLWALCGSVLVAIFGWYWMHHQDRYLITLVPWMATATACILVLAWRMHSAARIAVSTLVLAQAICSVEVYFAYANYSDTLSLITSAARGTYAAKLASFQERYSAIQEELPKDAILLVHDYHALLGLGRKTIADAAAWQGGLNYLQAPTDRGVYETLKRLGATHLLWRTLQSQDWDSQGANFVFLSFVQRHTKAITSDSDFSLAEMPTEPPPLSTTVPQVLVAVCPGSYPNGIHPITSLNKPGLDRGRVAFPAPVVSTDTIAEKRAALSQVQFVLLNRRCQPEVSPLLGGNFKLAARRGNDEQWVRRLSTTSQSQLK